MWVLEPYLKSVWALRVYSGMKYNILQIRQGPNNIKEKLRPVFTLNIHHIIPPLQTVVKSYKKLVVVVNRRRWTAKLGQTEEKKGELCELWAVYPSVPRAPHVGE